MDVTITIKVKVDKDAWNAEYWSDDKAADIREQVKGMAGDAVDDAFKHLAHVVEVVR